MKFLMTCLIAVVIVAMVTAIFVYSGAFDIAADVPHSELTARLIEAVRDRSIAVRIKDIQAPALDDPHLIAEGAEHYAAMCADCHLAPGVDKTDIRDGLYPAPPNLTRHIAASAAEMFWVVKHGIKMSAMPAWGRTHDDHNIWGIVAFLQKLPEITPEQYQALVKPPDKSDHHDHQHSHEHGSGGKHHE
jgi:mono/diheme cytochrome c family protein